MSICKVCNKRLEKGMKFCPNCGTSVEEKKNPQEMKIKSKGKKIIGGIVLSILLIGAVVGIVFIKQKKVTVLPAEMKVYEVNGNEYTVSREIEFDAGGRILRDTYFYGEDIGDQYEYFYEGKKMTHYIFTYEGKSFYIEAETEDNKAKNIVNYCIYDEEGETFFEEILVEYNKNENIFNAHFSDGESLFTESFKNCKMKERKLVMDDTVMYEYYVEYDRSGVILDGKVVEDGMSWTTQYSLSNRYDSNGKKTEVIALRNEEIECSLACDLAYDKIIYFFDEQERCIEEEKYLDGELSRVSRYFYE